MSVFLKFEKKIHFQWPGNPKMYRSSDVVVLDIPLYYSVI